MITTKVVLASPQGCVVRGTRLDFGTQGGRWSCSQTHSPALSSSVPPLTPSPKAVKSSAAPEHLRQLSWSVSDWQQCKFGVKGWIWSHTAADLMLPSHFSALPVTRLPTWSPGTTQCLSWETRIWIFFFYIGEITEIKCYGFPFQIFMWDFSKGQ